MHIALIEPEIPQNTGNISRTCVMTGSTLHLVGKLGFSIENRYLRRAGLDYWPYLTFYRYPDFHSLFEKYREHRFYFFTTKAEKTYAEILYTNDDFLVFGKETTGLPPEILQCWQGSCLRIPMIDNIPRSLNLSNAVAIVLYEALRQRGFPNMK
ncbi:MAG TPA: tRNA (cytidine(34)-2'-O)-methyltransferase [Firmicutes bacterium]|jgi:tRNA (cytidine/uridine-2'-O-)-methyltransferase|nr:tRNA (cytidine(34)-2'-O)-methyltransferase [Bacillota bacterium]